jgi:hypothetical protein
MDANEDVCINFRALSIRVRLRDGQLTYNNLGVSAYYMY